MILNTVRMVDYDQAREFSFGDDNSLKDKLAIGIINPEISKKLNLGTKKNVNVKVTSCFGEVIVKIKENREIPFGTFLMPISIWSNQITGTKSGMLWFKNIKVNVEPTEDPVKNFSELIKKIKSN